MRFRKARVNPKSGRRITGKSDVIGCEVEGTLRTVRVYADTELYLTDAQAEALSKAKEFTLLDSNRLEIPGMEIEKEEDVEI